MSLDFDKPTLIAAQNLKRNKLELAATQRALDARTAKLKELGLASANSWLGRRLKLDVFEINRWSDYASQLKQAIALLETELEPQLLKKPGQFRLKSFAHERTSQNESSGEPRDVYRFDYDVPLPTDPFPLSRISFRPPLARESRVATLCGYNLVEVFSHEDEPLRIHLEGSKLQYTSTVNGHEVPKTFLASAEARLIQP